MRLAALLALAAAVAALVVVASSSGTGSRSPVAARPTQKFHSSTPPAKHSVKRPLPPAHAAAGLPLVDARAIDRVLAYTPFITGGVPKHRVIALTFDDGPSPYTPGIVSALRRMHAPGTFFVVGQQLTDFAAGLRDELRAGFPIGDHTENHAWLIHLSRAGQYGQIHDAGVRIARLGTPFPRMFRPPYGAYNPQTIALLHKLRMLMVLWSVDPRDWIRPGTSAIIARVLSAARPGAIVELHDGGGDRSQTEAALPAIINGLRHRHYELVTIPQLLRLDPPPRNQRLPHASE
jgi:peptidoglycan/xylan/chitin deacetylase (PgdA/CDA1 family)